MCFITIAITQCHESWFSSHCKTMKREHRKGTESKWKIKKTNCKFSATNARKNLILQQKKTNNFFPTVIPQSNTTTSKEFNRLYYVSLCSVRNNSVKILEWKRNSYPGKLFSSRYCLTKRSPSITVEREKPYGEYISVLWIQKTRECF